MVQKKIKHRYLETLGVTIVVLALARCGYEHAPQWFAQGEEPAGMQREEAIPAAQSTEATPGMATTEATPARPHPIYSVRDYKTEFPDTNDLQLTAAMKWGVAPVENREDAELRKNELVYIDASPYYQLDSLQRSIPYLVPHAAVLLQDIGRAFFDSLYVKGVPLHKIIVTSVLRTRDDIAKLRNYNKNATERSCHLYGTTFDLCYNRYVTVESPDGPKRRQVRNDTLKWILSEVLRDMRREERCYIKYEVKQGCYHLTVR